MSDFDFVADKGIHISQTHLVYVQVSYYCNFVLDVPASPINLQAGEVTKSSVTLTWEAPEHDGGAPIVGYIVERSKAGGNRWLKAHKKPVTDTVYTVTDLVENAEYDFRVVAENEAGIGKPCQPLGPVKAKDAYSMLYHIQKFVYKVHCICFLANLSLANFDRICQETCE